MSDLVKRLRTACSPESPLGKLCAEAADVLDQQPTLFVRPEIITSTLVFPVRSHDYATKLANYNSCTIPLYRRPDLE